MTVTPYQITLVRSHYAKNAENINNSPKDRNEIDYMFI